MITINSHPSLFTAIRPGHKATNQVLYDFLVPVKAAPHECIIRTGQP